VGGRGSRTEWEEEEEEEEEEAALDGSGLALRCGIVSEGQQLTLAQPATTLLLRPPRPWSQPSGSPRSSLPVTNRS
jgi:hypothetical protein